VTLAIFACTKPVIAAINGPAVGIGDHDAVDGHPARRGAGPGRLRVRPAGHRPEACSTWFLPRVVGISQALEWMYFAELFDAAEARRGGLVRSVHAAEDLLPAAYALARRFVDARSPVATALMRQMMYRNSAQPHPVEAHRVESLAMFYTSMADGKEGVRAFRQKRASNFAGRASTDLPDVFPH